MKPAAGPLRRAAHTVTVVMVATFAGAGAFACSGSDNTGGSADAPVDPACKARIEATCQKAAMCLPAELTITFGSVDECIARELLTCANLYEAPGTALTPALESECAADIAASTCDEFREAEPPAACDPGPGTLPVGTACGFNAQCDTGYCRFLSPNICGKCAQRSDDGGACLGDADCNDGLGCTDDQQCTPLHTTAGDPCPCAPGLRCVSVKGAATCRARVALGGACSENFDCDGYPIRICNLQTSACEEVTIAATGEPCGPGESGGIVACAGGTLEGCVTHASGVAPVCEPPARDGESCVRAACEPPARCIGSQCVVFNDTWCR